MKKILFTLAIFTLASPLFTLPDFTLSAGGGGIFNAHWKTGILKNEYKEYGINAGGQPSPTPKTHDAMTQGLFDTKDLTLGGGVYGFFDATYAELSAAFIINRANQTLDSPDELVPPVNKEQSFTFYQLNFSLLLKYPFSLGERWSLFPLLGIDGQIGLGDFDPELKKGFQKTKSFGYDVPNLGEFWNSLWVKLGAGLDYRLAGNLFIRGELLYGLKLNSAYETKMAGYWAEQLGGIANGPNLRIGVGYRFFAP
jgi:opacity protein-like surface antigen